MAQVYVKYNPYRLATLIKINGKEIETDSTLYKVVKGKRLQEWIGDFPQMLRDELNTVDFEIEFYGMDLDWDDFEDAFQNAQKEGILKQVSLKFIEGKSDDDITEKIVRIFNDLQEGPIDDFRDPKLIKAFESINNDVFPVNVIATMSSGKSTLINALLAHKLMPSKNEACTATITEILDNDKDYFSAVAYDEKGDVVREIDRLTYEIMGELNDNEHIQRIAAEGNIPFLDARSTALMLVDTPGPNNARTDMHYQIMYRAIQDGSNNLILYVLNGTQLSTKDDNNLLHEVSDKIKQGGKQVRDRFLFVINKMDSFNPEEEDISKAVLAAKEYLASFEIEDPQIFPCSAFTALNIRTYFENVDIDNLTRAEEKQLSSAARDTLPMIDKFVEFESMHLEQYSTLSPSAQKTLDYQLQQAQERKNTKEQALIHCGIYSIENAITAYVKKYAKTKKIKDLVESFQDVLESNAVLTRVKTQVATDEAAAKACEERAAAVQEKISNGEEAKIFKDKVHQLDPMPIIQKKAEELKKNVTNDVSKIFKRYDDLTITSKEEAKRLINVFADRCSDAFAKLAANIESVIKHEIQDTGASLLDEYREKLFRIDENATDEQLDFNTVDLIKGVLTNMKENAEEWRSDQFVSETVEDVGKTETETRKYYEKVGQKKEEVVVGSHQEKIGTERVKVGSHREKTGTRTVRNPNKWRGPLGWIQFWEDKYIEEDIYEDVSDYEDKDVFETVMDYKTVMRDIYEERTETIEKFSADVSVIHTGLMSKVRRELDESIDAALDYAEDQITDMKDQFMDMFDDLDRLIKQKYDELVKCANDQKAKEEELEKNKELLSWIEACKAEIDEILDM